MYMTNLAWLLFLACQLYIWVLIARMIISWIPLIVPHWRPGRLVASVFEIIYTLTDPPINFLRRFIPPLNLGGVSLDLAFMAVFVLIYMIQRIIVAFM